MAAVVERSVRFGAVLTLASGLALLFPGRRGALKPALGAASDEAPLLLDGCLFGLGGCRAPTVAASKSSGTK